MSMRYFFYRLITGSVFAVGIAGCNQSEQAAMEPETSEAVVETDETDHLHDAPLTEEEIAQLKEETAQYADAVARIQQYQETVQQETTEGEPADAHRALDELTVVLDRLPAAARDSGVPKEKWQEVNETAQELRELFDQIHANIDAGEDPNYEAVAEVIDARVETLATIEAEPAE